MHISQIRGSFMVGSLSVRIYRVIYSMWEVAIYGGSSDIVLFIPG